MVTPIEKGSVAARRILRIRILRLILRAYMAYALSVAGERDASLLG